MANANEPADVATDTRTKEGGGIERLTNVQQYFSAGNPFEAPDGELSEAQRCAKAIFAASQVAFGRRYPDTVQALATGLVQFIESVRENPHGSLDATAPPLLEILDKALLEASWRDDASDSWKNINNVRTILCDLSCRLPQSLLLQEVQTGPEPDRGGYYADIFNGTYGGNRVAVKKFRTHMIKDSNAQSQMFRQRLHREIVLHHSLRHSNICPLIGAIPRENSNVPVAYPVTPWYEHGPVTDFLEGDKFVREKAFRFLVEISDGLLYLHEEGIAHGDIHPENILVDDDEHIKLCDFGVSKIWNPRLNSGTSRRGKEEYMAPEIIREDAKRIHPPARSEHIHHTPQSDVYSFGVVCWTIFTEAPLSLDKQAPTRPKVSGPRAIPDRLWKVMRRCWRDRPKERIPSSFLRVELRFLTRSLFGIDVPYPDSEDAR